MLFDSISSSDGFKDSMLLEIISSPVRIAGIKLPGFICIFATAAFLIA